LPSLRDHCGFPLFTGGQHFVLRAAHLCLEEVTIQSDLEAQLPPELMTAENAPRFDVVLPHHEQLAEVHGRTVPIRSLKDVHRRESLTLCGMLDEGSRERICLTPAVMTQAILGSNAIGQ